MTAEKGKFKKEVLLEGWEREKGWLYYITDRESRGGKRTGNYYIRKSKMRSRDPKELYLEEIHLENFTKPEGTGLFLKKIGGQEYVCSFKLKNS